MDETCEHRSIIAWTDVENGDSVGLWSCARCDQKFVPISELLAAESKLDPGQLFEFVKHGDAEHQEWLREALEAYVAGKPKPEPRGLGKHGAKIYALEAEVKALTSRLGDALKFVHALAWYDDEVGSIASAAQDWLVSIGEKPCTDSATADQWRSVVERHEPK